MIVGTGIDLIEIGRFSAAMKRRGAAMAERLFTEAEQAYCGGRPESLAVRFAAKEALMKALGTGLSGLKWREVEVVSGANGAPEIRLYGQALEKACALGATHFHVSLTHSRETAAAVVVLENRGPGVVL